MKLHFSCLLSLVLLLLAVPQSSESQTFFLDANGVTVKCIDCEPGDTGEVNGVVYTAVDNEMLFALKDPWIPYFDSMPDPAMFETVCTSLVTNLDSLFRFALEYTGSFYWNPDISSWDVSNVTTMASIFDGSGTYGTNPNLSSWDVGAVQNLDYAFRYSVFNGDLSNWDVSSVTSMRWTFARTGPSFSSVITFDENCYSLIDDDPYNYYYDPVVGVFNQNISSWDVSNVTSFERTFCGSEFNQPLNDWDVGSAVDMSFMFGGGAFNQPIGDWDVSNVVSMKAMFAATPFDQDISAWDVSSVVDAQHMFCSCAFNQDLSQWNTASLEDVRFMFANADEFNSNLNDWDVSNVDDMEGVFHSAENFNSPLNDWDVSNVDDMEDLFHGCASFNQDLNDWDVSNVEIMNSMFFEAEAFNGNICDWDVGNLVEMSGLFAGCVLFDQNLSNWNVSNVQDMTGAFAGCYYFNQPIGSWDVSGVADGDYYYDGMDGLFYEATTFNQDLSCWCVSQFDEEPDLFRDGAVAFEPPNWPQWGDCPDPATCPDPIACASTGVGVDDTESVAGIELMPNPAFGQVLVDAPAGAVGYSILTLTGQEILSRQATFPTVVDVESLAPGIYLMAIGAQVRRLVVGE